MRILFTGIILLFLSLPVQAEDQKVWFDRCMLEAENQAVGPTPSLRELGGERVVKGAYCTNTLKNVCRFADEPGSCLKELVTLTKVYNQSLISRLPPEAARGLRKKYRDDLALLKSGGGFVDAIKQDNAIDDERRALHLEQVKQMKVDLQVPWFSSQPQLDFFDVSWRNVKALTLLKLSVPDER